MSLLALLDASTADKTFWFICSWCEINLNLVNIAMNTEQTTSFTSSDHQKIHQARAEKQHSWKAWKQESS